LSKTDLGSFKSHPNRSDAINNTVKIPNVNACDQIARDIIQPYGLHHGHQDIEGLEDIAMNPASSAVADDSTAPPDRKLSDYLCFAIYSANLAFGKAYKPILEELGLTYTQYITVIALWEQDNQTVSGLGEKLFLESNTLTPILKKLEGMGYLSRQRGLRG
jgi:hypothetical protein